MEQALYIIIGSNVATFVLAWIVCRVATRHQFLKEQTDMESKRRNTEMWIEFIKTQGGAK